MKRGKIRNKEIVRLRLIPLIVLLMGLMLVVWGFSVGEFGREEGVQLGPGSCTDSDGGIDYYLKGFSDTCDESMCRSSYDYCSDTEVLNEYYCENISSFGIQQYTCPNGCFEGACLL